MSPAILRPTVINGWDVEEALIATLDPRLARYASQLDIAPVKAYTRAHQFDKWPEDQVPMVSVTCPGMADQPTRHGDGKYTARWAVGVVALTSAATEDDTRRLSRVYAGLIRAVLLQEPSLHGLARSVTWTDESYDELDVKRRRNLSTAELTFIVEVDGVVDANELPLMPSGPIPTPSDHDVTVTEINVEITEEVNP